MEGGCYCRVMHIRLENDSAAGSLDDHLACGLGSASGGIPFPYLNHDLGLLDVEIHSDGYVGLISGRV